MTGGGGVDQPLSPRRTTVESQKIGLRPTLIQIEQPLLIAAS